MVGEGEIEVSPGMAIDCAGNEVVLSMAMRATIPPSTVKLYVTITYCESETDPVPVISGDPEYTRTLEGATLAFSNANPGRLHHGMGPRTSGCGLCHAISLAALTRHGGGWRIQRRRHGA